MVDNFPISPITSANWDSGTIVTGTTTYPYNLGVPDGVAPVPVVSEKKKTQKMEVELCLCSKALWT